MHAPHPKIIPAETLLLAYRSGIFPMADSRDDPDVFWVEPRLRAIMPLDGFHCSHSLAKLIRQDRFRVTVNHAFDEVLAACAAPRAGPPGKLDQRADRRELPRAAPRRPRPFGRMLAGRGAGRRALRSELRPGVLRREHVQPRRATPRRSRSRGWWC